MEDTNGGGPKRSVSTQHIASNSNASTIGTLSRIHPVASPSSSLSNLLTISAELRKSDPSLHRKKASVSARCQLFCVYFVCLAGYANQLVDIVQISDV